MELFIILLALVVYFGFCTGNSMLYSIKHVQKRYDRPDSPLKDKTIVFLGSSVTSGYGSHGVSFVDYLAAFHHFHAIKEAVPGTTLAELKPQSYVTRLNKLLEQNKKEHMKVDCFVCQLSTNDAALEYPIGEVSTSFHAWDYDTKTSIGAMEYIIASVRRTWHCPILFYVPQQYNNKRYPELIAALYQIQEKWDIHIVDLWNDKQVNKIFNHRPTYRSMDGLHPTMHGYLACYVPAIEKELVKIEQENMGIVKHWWKEAVVYQIYPRSFMDTNGDGIGDLNGITAKMDYLDKLGIDVIWLSPVYQSPNADNGYDISDYRSIMEEFGTMEDFDRMLAAAHERHIKIMMDLVVNHTSDEHIWFAESRQSKDNPYRDYYIWRKGAGEGEAPNRWGSFFGGSAWKYDAQTDEYYLHLFSEKQPDLNWDNAKVREKIYSMMSWWCDKGIDGFRMDVISMISKVEGLPEGKPIPGSPYTDGSAAYVNGPHVHEYLKEMNEKVLSRYDLITVGEAAGVTAEEATKYAGEQSQELNMVFQFEHVGDNSEMKSNFGKWDLERMPLPLLKKIMTKWQTQLHGQAWNSLYLSNHDQPRSVSRFGNDSPQYRALSAKMLATCLHMMEGTPYIYQGEELGMTNAGFTDINSYRDIESLNCYQELCVQKQIPEEIVLGYLRNMSRDNARTPMQWDASTHAGFTWGQPWIAVNPNYETINAEAELKDPDSVFAYYQKLIRFRHELDVIVYGTYELLAPEDEKLYLYTRSLFQEELLVACNFTADTVPLPTQALQKIRPDSRLLISNYQEHKGHVLQPYEAIVYLSGKQ